MKKKQYDASCAAHLVHMHTHLRLTFRDHTLTHPKRTPSWRHSAETRGLCDFLSLGVRLLCACSCGCNNTLTPSPRHHITTHSDASPFEHGWSTYRAGRIYYMTYNLCASENTVIREHRLTHIDIHFHCRWSAGSHKS